MAVIAWLRVNKRRGRRWHGPELVPVAGLDHRLPKPSTPSASTPPPTPPHTRAASAASARRRRARRGAHSSRAATRSSGPTRSPPRRSASAARASGGGSTAGWQTQPLTRCGSPPSASSLRTTRFSRTPTRGWASGSDISAEGLEHPARSRRQSVPGATRAEQNVFRRAPFPGTQNTLLLRANRSHAPTRPARCPWDVKRLRHKRDRFRREAAAADPGHDPRPSPAFIVGQASWRRRRQSRNAP